MVCLPWADSDQCFNVSDAYFRWLFRMTVSDHCSRWLFRMPVSDDYSGLLFRMTISDAYFRWLFQMTVPNDYFGCLFQMTFPDNCFGLLFQMNISDVCSQFHGWFLFYRPIRISTVDSYFNQLFDWLVPLLLIRFWTAASYCRILTPISPDTNHVFV